MASEALRQRTEAVRARVTPALLEDAVDTLLRQGEDIGGGVNATRLVKCLLDDPHMEDEEVVWAYDRLKPAFRAAFEEVTALHYFEGD